MRDKESLWHGLFSTAEIRRVPGYTHKRTVAQGSSQERISMLRKLWQSLQQQLHVETDDMKWKLRCLEDVNSLMKQLSGLLVQCQDELKLVCRNADMYRIDLQLANLKNTKLLALKSGLKSLKEVKLPEVRLNRLVTQTEFKSVEATSKELVEKAQKVESNILARFGFMSDFCVSFLTSLLVYNELILLIASFFCHSPDFLVMLI